MTVLLEYIFIKFTLPKDCLKPVLLVYAGNMLALRIICVTGGWLVENFEFNFNFNFYWFNHKG